MLGGGEGGDEIADCHYLNKFNINTVSNFDSLKKRKKNRLPSTLYMGIKRKQ